MFYNLFDIQRRIIAAEVPATEEPKAESAE